MKWVVVIVYLVVNADRPLYIWPVAPGFPTEELCEEYLLGVEREMKEKTKGNAGAARTLYRPMLSTKSMGRSPSPLFGYLWTPEKTRFL